MNNFTLKIFAVLCICCFSMSQMSAQCTAGGGPFCYTSGSQQVGVEICPDPGKIVEITFTAGEVENTYDELEVYCGATGTGSSGSQIYSGYGSGGDLTGLVVECGIDECLSVFVNGDGSISCAENPGDYESIVFTSLCKDPPAAPSNDLCSGATDVTANIGIDGVCGATNTGNNTAATDSGITEPSCTSSGAYVGGDIWFEFTVPAGQTQVDYTRLSSVFSTTYTSMYSGTCAGLVEEDCTSAASASWTGLTSGATYYIRFFDWGNNNFGDVTFCLNTPPAAPECATNVAPADGAVDQPTVLTLEWAAPATGSPPASYDIYYGDASGDLVNTNLGFTNTTSTTWSVSGLNYATTYYWLVVPKNSGGSATGCTEWEFTTEDAPPGTCGNPIALTAGDPCVTGDTDLFGNALAFSFCGGSYGDGDDDAVYSYTPAADGNFDLLVSAIDDTYAGVFVFTGACPADGTTSCDWSATNGNSSADLLSEGMAFLGGTTYYIIVTTWGSPNDVGFCIEIDENLTAAPECATNVAPADGAVDQPTALTLEWAAPATGSAPTSYDVYYGDASGDLVNTNLGSTNTTSTTWSVSGLNHATTYYWLVVPKNSGGSATSCTEWEFATCSVGVALSTTGATNTCAATYAGRTGSGHYYDYYEFVPSADGDYNIYAAWTAIGVGSEDGYLYIYDSGFDPATPSTSIITFDDDGPNGAADSEIVSVALTGGLTYYIVGTGYSAGTILDMAFEILPLDCGGGGTAPAVTPNTYAAASGIEGVATGTLASACNEGEWTRYGDGTNDGFAIKWGANLAAKAAAEVSVTMTTPGPSAVNATAEAFYEMQRSWNVDLGAESLSAPVEVRFYYENADKAAVEAAAAAFVTANGATLEPFSWFKNPTGAYVPGMNLTAAGLTGQTNLTGTVTMLDATIDYVEMVVSSFSGGSGAAGATGGALPIELASFTGKTMAKSNMLEWTTASEENTEFHIIERSSNGRNNWTKVGVVDAKGFSNDFVNYALEDTKPAAKSYYRLRSVDFDGYEDISHIVYLERKTDRFEIIAAYPVPTKASLSIDFETVTDQEVNISMTNILGHEISRRVFAATAGINTQTLDMSKLSSGVYFVTIHNGLESITKRVVKN